MKRKFSIGLVLVLSMGTVILAAEGKWTKKADMPTARYCIAASEVNGKIYVIGGWDSWADSTPLATVEMYDPATDTWERKADMPTARGTLATAVLDGKIYAIGGAIGQSSMRTVEIYDPVTDTWEQGVSMSTGRWFHSAVVLEGRIYAIGGAFSSTMEEYDPDTGIWTRKASMPTDRWVFGAGVMNGRIYVIGGDTSGGLTSSVLEYNPITDSWTQKSNMPTTRAALSAVVFNDKIYCIGGSINPNSPGFSTLEVYNPATDTWEKKDDMPTPRSNLTVTMANGNIYAIGGFSDRICSTVEQYNTNPLVVDFNGDGIVDSADISMMVDYWHTNESLYDIAPRPLGDGIVDVQDLILLSEHLFEEPGLIAHWKLDETDGGIAYDSTGINDAVVSGNALWHPDGGQIDGALQFDGIDDYVITPFVLNPAKEAFSIFAWVGNGAPGQMIIAQMDSANWLCVDSLEGNLMTEFKGTGRTGCPLLSKTVIADGQWHRIGLVWDGAYRTLYVDDIVVAQDTQNGLRGSDNGLYIGCGKGTESGTYFSGLIDDVRIYNRIVSP
jgi:N-acetylneuraminic acid mutarotase